MNGIWLASYVILWIVVGGLALMVISLLRLVGQLHQRVGPSGALVTDSGPQIEEPLVKVLEAEGIADNPALIFPRPKDLLMVFVSPNCPACDALVKSLALFSVRYKMELDVLMISTSRSPAKNAALLQKAGIARIPYVMLPNLSKAVGITGTPFGIWVDQISVVRAKGILNHTEHLESLRNARNSGYASFEEYLDSVESESA